MKLNLCIRRPCDGPAASASADGPITGSNDRPLSNLFARLDDDAARRLSSLARDRLEKLNSIQCQSHARNRAKSGLWVASDAAFSSRVESGVEFLPLRIEIRSEQTQRGDGDTSEGDVNIIYASYNGGSVQIAPAGKSRHDKN